MDIWWVFVLVSGCSFLLTGLIRRYALSRNVVDIPNIRSSHLVPTARGGGIAVVLSFLLTLPFLERHNWIPTFMLWSLVGGGAWIALIGFIDDHKHVPARWRLLAHFIGASYALIWQGGLPPLPIFGFILDMGWLGHLTATFYLVWLLNLYNFMDGIDGIAGVEAVTVCFGGTILYILSPAGNSEWVLSILLLAAVIGFLVWNFPKARIFMGDAGSGFVGLILGMLSIQAAWVMPDLLWGWIILLGSFVVDATVTLIHRVMQGQLFFEAHRSHAYQYASRKYHSHSIVTLTFGAINLVWLLPIASIVVLGWIDGVLGIVISYLPLIFLAIYFKAGEVYPD